MLKPNKHHTAVKDRLVWHISRGLVSQLVLEFSDSWDGISPVRILSTVREDWVGTLLTKKDRKILRKAYDAGVFEEVWKELDKIRSEQYAGAVKDEKRCKEKAAEKLIKEVRDNA